MRNRCHGTGAWTPDQLAQHGPDCIFETGVLILTSQHTKVGREAPIFNAPVENTRGASGGGHQVA